MGNGEHRICSKNVKNGILLPITYYLFPKSVFFLYLSDTGNAIRQLTKVENTAVFDTDKIEKTKKR
jgi:hypothetical protein